jgi:ABC-type lipoprotein release transport system permease subunit
MKNIPLSYSIRNLFARKLTFFLTLTGITLVVFVFCAVLMLAYGLQKTMVDTGRADNIILYRKGSDSELSSGVDRNLVNIIATLPQVGRSASGQPIQSPEVLTVINLDMKSNSSMGNISVRGVTPGMVFTLRPDVTIADGRSFNPGSREIIIGSAIQKRFQNTNIGQTIKFGGDEWTIVGIFDGDGSAYESELWGDVDQLMQAFNRQGAFSSVTVRLAELSQLPSLQETLESDNRLLTLKAESEPEYYRRQSRYLNIFIRVMGLSITLIFSIGAVIGAMITMYAAVSNRTKEIGVLRALGFKRRNVLASFLFESIFLSLLGGSLGILLASLLQFLTFSTINFGTFSDITFGYILNREIILYGLLFSITMGLAGGFLPAVQASRQNIVSTMRGG